MSQRTRVILSGAKDPLSARKIPRSRRSLGMTVVLFSLAGARLGAQVTSAVATIDPGMTREQVVAKLGQPLSSRSFEAFTYLLYRNGCEKKCGMNDLVVLDSGKVIDAVFRSPERKYTGTSSSPRSIPAAEVRKMKPAAPTPAPTPPPATKKPPHVETGQ